VKTSIEDDLRQLILVVDDQPDHLQIIENVLSDDTNNTQIVTISTTTEATDFILSQGRYTQSQQPDVVLLNMRLADGQAQTLLTTIKTSPKLRKIPTIVLTPDASEEEVLNSYQQQCNSLVVKPRDLAHLSKTLQVVKSFWLNIVTLPIK